MPTTVETFTYKQLQPAAYPDMARVDAGRFAPNLSIAAGTAIGKITGSGLLAAYSNANNNGTETCLGFAQFDFRTDANGLVYFGTEAAGANQRATPVAEAPYYIAGAFRTADLTGYDAAALVELRGRVLASGVIYIP